MPSFSLIGPFVPNLFHVVCNVCLVVLARFYTNKLVVDSFHMSFSPLHMTLLSKNNKKKKQQQQQRKQQQQLLPQLQCHLSSEKLSGILCKLLFYFSTLVYSSHQTKEMKCQQTAIASCVTGHANWVIICLFQVSSVKSV